MTVEDDVRKLREDVKEIKRQHGILDEYATGVNNLVSEFNEARKKDIAKLTLDLKNLTATVAKKK